MRLLGTGVSPANKQIWKMNIRFTLLLLLFSGSAYCQTKQAGKVSATLLVEDLYSTHNDHFTGVSFRINRTVTKNFSIGAGLQHSHTPVHRDNGWNLYRLQFFPLFVSQTYSLRADKKTYPFLHAEEGISFNRYSKEYQNNPGPLSYIKEKGIYAYFGGGLSSNVNGKFNLTAEAGFKGFHFSANQLDVNPHGVTGKLGVEWNFQKK